MFDFYDRNRYPKELKEITEKIASGKPPINWDDILDFFVGLEKYEKRTKRSSKKKDGKKERRYIKR